MTGEQDVQIAASQLKLPDPVSIRAWNESDYPEVRSLAFAEGWTTLTDRPEDGLRAWKHSWPALVVTHQELVIGFLRAITDGAVTLYVADLLVTPDWRGQGIGGGLLHVCHILYPSVRFDLLSIGTAANFYEIGRAHV